MIKSTGKKKIGIVIYANPDYYPPTVNAIQILAKEFDLMVISRNQDDPYFIYPDNVKLYRLGKLKTARGKEAQAWGTKILEYLIFVIRTIFYIRFYRCCLIYSYDMHGVVASFIASRFGRTIPLIYHNHELSALREVKGLSLVIKRLELWFARYADKIIFPDLNRARFFQREAKLAKLPDIVMNTPLRVSNLPYNRLRDFLKINGFDENTKIALYQGVINEGHCLLEILKSMAYWPPNVVLVLGGYPYADFIKELLKVVNMHNLARRVIRLPFVPYSQLFSYTVGACIGFSLVSPKDINNIFIAGASNKIFEYISLGIPVIANDSPYFKEVLDPSIAYFAKPDSVEDIGMVINSVFSNGEEYRRKCQAARDIHLTRFNYEEQFKSILGYIRQICR